MNANDCQTGDVMQVSLRLYRDSDRRARAYVDGRPLESEVSLHGWDAREGAAVQIGGTEYRVAWVGSEVQTDDCPQGWGVYVWARAAVPSAAPAVNEQHASAVDAAPPCAEGCGEPAARGSTRCHGCGERPAVVGCECGEVTGVRCAWAGPRAETVEVEWMPDSLRAVHAAARASGGGCGVYPANGARRLRVESGCADVLLETEGEWARVVEE